MNRKTLITVVAVAVAVLVAVLVAVSLKKSGTGLRYGPTVPGGAPAPSGPVTRQAAPTNVVVPGQGAKDAPKDVAVPNTVSPGSPSGSTSYRSFSIKISGNEFTPNTVIVKKGDTIDLNFTAVDRDYDFTQPDFGFKVTIPKGSSKKVQFGGTAPDKFTFYCSVCGGPSQGPVGYVVIAAP